jgi:hypothetical protein
MGMLQLGHLSAELLVVIGTCMLSHASARRTADDAHLPATMILAIGCTSVWLPLQILPGVLAIGIVWRLIVLLRNNGLKSMRRSPIFFSMLLVPGAFLISRNLVIYVTHTNSTATNLFAAGGAVRVFQSTTFLFMVILLAAALFLKADPGEERRFDPLPILLACGVVITLLAEDYYRTGSSNYGTTKATFLIVSMALPLLVLAVSAGLAERVSSVSPNWRIFSVSLILGLSLAVDGSVFGWLEVTKKNQWKPVSSVSDGGWKQFTAVRDGSSQDLDELPVGCAVAGPRPEVLEVNDDSYLCTRFLTAITGLESEAGPLVEWQLRRSWEASLPYLAELPDELLRRKIIVLSGNKVLGLQTLTTYLELNGYKS